MTKLPTIKFSNRYHKMPVDFQESKLIQVLGFDIGELTEEFREYDTKHATGYYPLGGTGRYLMLFLLTGSGYLWTTIRRATSEKEEYYKNMVGKMFKCVVTSNALLR